MKTFNQFLNEASFPEILKTFTSATGLDKFNMTDYEVAGDPKGYWIAYGKNNANPKNKNKPFFAVDSTGEMWGNKSLAEIKKVITDQGIE